MGVENLGKPMSAKDLLMFQLHIVEAFSKLPSKQQRNYLKVAKLVAADNSDKGVETANEFIAKRNAEDREGG